MSGGESVSLHVSLLVSFDSLVPVVYFELFGSLGVASLS